MALACASGTSFLNTVRGRPKKARVAENVWLRFLGKWEGPFFWYTVAAGG